MGNLPRQPQSFFAPTTRAFSISSKNVRELSGLVQSRRNPQLLWGHNDSGDSSRIFAINKQGIVVCAPEGITIKHARNVDWEDIAYDQQGNLYVSDMGNNRNKRKDLGVYVFPEPLPTQKSVSNARFLPVYYPEQRANSAKTDPRFDCEAIFVYQNALYFLTKERMPGSLGFPSDTTTLYRLENKENRENREGQKPQPLRKLDTKDNLGGWVTGADVSLDEKRLAILCHFPTPCVWLFELGKTGDRLLQGKSKQIKLKDVGQCEAICFENAHTLLIGNESGEVFRVKIA
jgi:hypothetical protein